MVDKPESKTELFERLLTQPPQGKYRLRLFVAGTTSRSIAAIENIHQICEKYLKDNYDLEVIDIYQQPELLQENQIIAAPTLIKTLPPPLRTFIGDMSKQERLLLGMDIIPRDQNQVDGENK